MTATGRSVALECLLPAAFFLVTRAHGRLDVAAHVEVAFELDFDGVARAHEVFEYDVDDVLVEYLHVAERVYVELQTFKLDAALVRHVFEPERGEVREVRERADAR